MAAESSVTQIFRVVRNLLHHDNLGETFQSLYDQYAMYFANKMNRIRIDLDSGLTVKSLDTPSTSSSCVLWDVFRLTVPEDVAKIVDSVRHTTCLPESCPLWLIWVAQEGPRRCVP